MILIIKQSHVISDVRSYHTALTNGSVLEHQEYTVYEFNDFKLANRVFRRGYF